MEVGIWQIRSQIGIPTLPPRARMPMMMPVALAMSSGGVESCAVVTTTWKSANKTKKALFSRNCSLWNELTRTGDNTKPQSEEYRISPDFLSRLSTGGSHEREKDCEHDESCKRNTLSYCDQLFTSELASAIFGRGLTRTFFVAVHIAPATTEEAAAESHATCIGESPWSVKFPKCLQWETLVMVASTHHRN